MRILHISKYYFSYLGGVETSVGILWKDVVKEANCKLQKGS